MRLGSLSISLALAGVIAMTSFGGSTAEKVRRSVLAGSWYEGTREGLTREVDGYLAKASPPEIEGRIVGLISPHAGYMYSGQAAAYGYALIRGRSFSRVIVIAPSHRVPFEGISIPEFTHYETPLGKIPLDVEACKRLLGKKGFSTVSQAHAEEHSLEIQLPFLQRVLGEFQLVPMVVGEIRRGDHAALAKAIREVMDENTLIVASSDFTHFGYRFGYLPFKTDVKDNLRRLDLGAVDLILKKDSGGFLQYKAETGATICGAHPIAILIETLPQAARGELLNYYTSGDLTGDFDNSVSYVSVVFHTPNGKAGRADVEESSEKLSEKEQQTLLHLARETIETFERTKDRPRIAAADPRLTPELKAARGVFVTLKISGRLRGCIGHIIPRMPLYEGVIENATNAGWRDPRFPPLTEAEIPDLDIEISVLTVPRKVSSPADIVIGTHGVILEKGGHSAVYLPQVAPEQGWGIEETLSSLSMKAGLAPDAWREGAEFSVFEAQVFGEE